MLPSSKRLTIPLFKSVMDQGKIFHSPFFMARMQKVEGLRRFSVVVSKKVTKLAVDRNKIRRRVYEALRPFDTALSTSIHAIFIVKSPILKATQEEIVKEFADFFVKTGLMK